MAFKYPSARRDETKVGFNSCWIFLGPSVNSTGPERRGSAVAVDNGEQTTKQ